MNYKILKDLKKYRNKNIENIKRITYMLEKEDENDIQQATILSLIKQIHRLSARLISIEEDIINFF